MASQNQPSGTQKRENAQQAIPATPVNVNCNCTNQTDSGHDKPQGWYKLVTWPEGVATWALIFTLGAICWQSWETRRSVAVGLRPKLIIRGIEFLPGEQWTAAEPAKSFWHIRICIANSGGSPAKVVESNLTFAEEKDFSDGLKIILPPFPRYSAEGLSFGSFPITAGQHINRDIKLSEEMSAAFGWRENLRTNDREVPYAAIFWWGFVRYEDSGGVNRTTGFGFRYDVKADRFSRMSEPEYNYSD